MKRYIFHVQFWNMSPVKLDRFHFTTVQETQQAAMAECLRYLAGNTHAAKRESEECEIKLIGTEPQREMTG